MNRVLPLFLLFFFGGFLLSLKKQFTFSGIFILFLGAASFAQQGTVTGSVTSDDSAWAGVTVQVKGTNTTIQANNDGRFGINAASNATLVVIKSMILHTNMTDMQHH